MEKVIIDIGNGFGLQLPEGYQLDNITDYTITTRFLDGTSEVVTHITKHNLQRAIAPSPNIPYSGLWQAQNANMKTQG